MERSRNTTDAYCELYYGKNDVVRTQTVYNNLEPEWNESFAFESTEDEELLRINVIDADVITRDDLIGTVIIDLSSLINRENNQTIKGNFPIVDINLGIRVWLQSLGSPKRLTM